MRKPALIAIVLLLIIATSTVTFNLISANFDPSMFKGDLKNATTPSIMIHSPLNTTCQSNNLNLDLTIEIGKLSQLPLFGEEEVRSIQLEADWMTNITTIQLSYILSEDNFHIPLYPENVSYTLVDIPDGNHTLKIIAFETGLAGWNENDSSVIYEINANSSATVNFAIDTTPPKITILSIGNKTYGTIDLPLKFYINETASQIYYSLDNNANTTINGNTTLNNLSYGSHSLTIYANDTVGHLGKIAVSFSVVQPNEILLAIVNLLPIALTVCLIGIAIVLIVYKIRHSKTNLNALIPSNLLRCWIGKMVSLSCRVFSSQLQQ
jgi:hypothetical protein